ncbi:MAG TPA: hypothetical protein VFD27_11835, partial [Chthoniobacteraceae bacterium]|nr:hypothetical protein [Chthoniobacteraceae bacterium]
MNGLATPVGTHGGGLLTPHALRPGTEPGKLMATSFDGVFAVRPAPSYPLRAAYWHAAVPELLAHVNDAGGDPAGNAPT